jgi:hypothetical protein
MPVGQGHIEDLDENPSDVLSNPLIEDANQKPSISISARPTLGLRMSGQLDLSSGE